MNDFSAIAFVAQTPLLPCCPAYLKLSLQFSYFYSFWFLCLHIFFKWTLFDSYIL